MARLEGGCAAWQGWREVQAGAWKYYGEIILNIIGQEKKETLRRFHGGKICKLFIVVYVKNFSLLHQSVFIQDKMHRTQKDAHSPIALLHTGFGYSCHTINYFKLLDVKNLGNLGD